MSTVTIVSVLALASVAVAHNPAFGRFPCDATDANGNIIANTGDQTKCTNAYMTNVYNSNTGDAPQTAFDNTSDDDKATGFVPAAAQCVQDALSGNFFCGWEGAACVQGNDNTANTNCDNGACVAGTAASLIGAPTGANGVCSGLAGATCNGLNQACLGYLYCTDGENNPVQTCGGTATDATDPTTYPGNAYCAEPYLSDGAATTTAFDLSQFDTLCTADAFCNQAGECQDYEAAGGDCTNMPNACGAGTTCVGGVCTLTASAGARSRSRRNVHSRGLCPASHTACSLAGSRTGFECVDTTSNLEQCGACASAGGVDCTAIPGVEAVGCVEGLCQIWQCAEGFTYDASSQSCIAGLVV